MNILPVESVEISEKRLKLELRLEKLGQHEVCRQDFLTFVRTMWPQFIVGEHHRTIADKLERIAKGELTRLIINMPPRHTKSEFASFLFPAWMIGRDPAMKIIQATHTTELAIGFGRKVKNLLEREEYTEVFPDTKLSYDSKASGRWDTNNGGMYYAVGVGSNLAGRGGDLIIIDDPHSEQTAMSNTGFEDAWDWYTGGPRQRLQPGGAIVLVQTRWSEKDLTAQLLRAQAKDHGADQWEIVELPAILPSGKACWPEYWPLQDLERVRASIPLHKWNAQYQQQPTSDETSILKREWWKIWTNLILLDSKKGRWDFPDLKEVALEQFNFWEPETVIIEAKASGLPLTQELRNVGIPVVNFTPSKGNDKLARVHAISPLLESGMVWAPEESWAEELMEECAAFPHGEYDDLVDSMTQALMRYRQGNFIQLPTDDWEDDPSTVKPRAYYG